MDFLEQAKKRFEEQKRREAEKDKVSKAENMPVSKPKPRSKPTKNLSGRLSKTIASKVDNIDITRGIYAITTLSTDRKMNKYQMEQSVKSLLSSPKGFGDFLENLSQWLRGL